MWSNRLGNSLACDIITASYQCISISISLCVPVSTHRVCEAILVSYGSGVYSTTCSVADGGRKIPWNAFDLHMHTCTHTYIHAHTYVHNTCTHFVCVCCATCVSVHVCVRVYMCVRVCMFV